MSIEQEHGIVAGRATPPGPSADRGDDGAAAGSLAGAQVIDRVIDILETFTWLGPELGVGDITRALGLKKATAHRLLASLRRRGIVAQDPGTRKYRLGMKLWELGSMATSQVDWIDRVHPYLEELTHTVGETTHLAILSDSQVLYVDKVESTRSLRMPSQVGRRLPAHCSGVGKALIAFLPDEVLAALAARRGLPRFTEHTITDLDALRAELATVRQTGYAVDREEIEDGLVCIGAPIRDHTTKVVAAISVAGPASRLQGDVLTASAADVVAVAVRMSEVLGCPPDAASSGAPIGATSRR